MADSTHHPFTNRLAAETSPYLLQHQHNPVDWRPWGPEALDVARTSGKPIFLSVGYSTCYWCHVMERQSFENEAIAKLMNELFICIKVDREERPDVDQLYMIAVQLITRQGGWPMSVFLTPDGRPFYGGTYYPPTDMGGRPGFPRVLRSIHDAWTNRRSEVEESCEQIVSLLRRVAGPNRPDNPTTIERAQIGSLIDRSTVDYEPQFGGFGHAPKFPRQTVLELLLAYLASDWDEKAIGSRKPKAKVRQMTLHALDAMMHGGIRDHLGGGFHRYSTDAKWLVPHFEIMLYDNAMLLACYAEAFRQTGDPRYAQVARDIADFVLREMTSPDGAFFTAMDAEVDGQEGLNYLWTQDEIIATLGDADAERFNKAYGVDLGPNFADPHHGSGVADKNILYIARPSTDNTSPLLEPEIRSLRQKLYDVRKVRKQPLLDTKVLTSWNGLMIRALAIAGRILNESRYTVAASKAASFLLTDHRTPEGGLYRTSRLGVKKFAGFLDDYAFLAWGLTELATATGEPRWRTSAEELVEQIRSRFGDTPSPASAQAEPGALYFTDRSADELIVRQKVAGDSPLPSGNAAAALAMLALGRPQSAAGIVADFASSIQEQGESMSSLVQAAMGVLLAGETIQSTPTASDSLREELPIETPAARGERLVDATLERTAPGELTLTLDIADGWHINAHKPGPAGLVGLSLIADPPDTAIQVTYPPGDPLQLPFATEPVAVNSDIVRLTIRHEPESPIHALTIRYQACDESACLSPTTKRIVAPSSE